jgi:hypothetical protein
LGRQLDGTRGFHDPEWVSSKYDVGAERQDHVVRELHPIIFECGYFAPQPDLIVGGCDVRKSKRKHVLFDPYHVLDECCLAK